MKYFLIAGEASGDLHASNLMKGLRKNDELAEFRFIGGDKMSEIGGENPLRHFRELNFMGIFAVVKNLRVIGKALREAQKNILEWEPDAVILVDYAGFNLRIAKKIANRNCKVFYYISPKVWAWKKGRIKKLKQYIDKLFVIFPFEKEFFRLQGMEVEYFGNPLNDIHADFSRSQQSKEDFFRKYQLDERPLVALLAGSRRQEIKACLPEMELASKHFPDHQFVIAGAPSVDADLYREVLESEDIRLVNNDTYNLLSHADAAVVTSGTATLETALFDVPQVVVYKTGWLTYRIGKLFVTFRFFSLVNLIFNDELVKELLQFRLAERIQKELELLLYNQDYVLKMKEGYNRVRNLIGKEGASNRAASRMVELLR